METKRKYKIFDKGKQITLSEQREYKNKIHVFFEGVYNLDYPPMVDIPVIKLGVTDFYFEKFKKRLEITITLQRPGLLIGKHGTTIDSLIEYLSTKDLPVKILIKESNVWN